MADRYTQKDAEGIVGRLAEKLGANPSYGPGHVYLLRESGVYRVRLVLRGGGESDLSPGMTTAREVWLYARGVLDGLGNPSDLRYEIARQDG